MGAEAAKAPCRIGARHDDAATTRGARRGGAPDDFD